MEKNYKKKLESQSTNNISQQIKKPASMIHTSNLKNTLSLWPRLDALDKRFLSETHMIMAIRTEKGNIDKDVFIIVKKDGKVYSYGGDTNKCSCLFNKSTSYSFFEFMTIRNNEKPTEIKKLCEQNIKKFIQQHTYGLYVLTKEGEVYSFGDHRYHPLGKKMSNTVFEPILLTSLSDFNIKDIVCNTKHALALTVDGKVYTWGKDTMTSDLNNETPQQVKSKLENKKVVSIACGMSYSIVVTNIGEVYSWGSLFTDDTSKQQLSNIRRIPFSATIVKVVCGFKHVLALTDQGDLYVWGNNNHGQLGTGNKTNIHDPFLLNTSEMGKLSDIAALSMKHISVAVNENRCIYVWGQYTNCEILTPRAFLHMNMYDVFASENVMYEPLILSADDHEESNIIMRCLKDAFDNPSTSDFKVQVEGRDIHVHKAVLKICSSHFRTMFQHEWTENNKNVLKLDVFSYNVYKAYLKYLYTDVIDIPLEESFELLKLADMYGEMNLKADCISVVRRVITVSNVAFFYSKAILYNEKRLEEFCFSFILRNMRNVILTESFMELDEKTKNMFFIKGIEAGIFKT